MKTSLLTILVVLVVAAGTVWVVTGTGVVDPSATTPHHPMIESLLVRARHSAVDRRAEDLTVPDLTSEALWVPGVRGYQEMCSTCHGGPGVERSAIGRGLNPPPPDLATATFTDHEAREAFWIVKHGLRMTGMPAFGPSLSDEEIWSLVAVQKRLADLTPDEYRRHMDGTDRIHSGPGTGPGEINGAEVR